MDSARSGLVAGVISAVIWIIITAATGGGAASIWVGGLILLVAVALVTYVITEVVARSKRA
jgi:hypothetical protein